MDGALFFVFILMGIGYAWLASDAIKEGEKKKIVKGGHVHRKKYELLYKEFEDKCFELSKCENLVRSHSLLNNSELADKYRKDANELRMRLSGEQWNMDSAAIGLSGMIIFGSSEKERWIAKRMILDITADIATAKMMSSSQARELLIQEVKEEVAKIKGAEKWTADPEREAVIAVINRYR